MTRKALVPTRMCTGNGEERLIEMARGERESMNIRREEWENFSKIVGDHIDNYTVAQYGDSPNDQVEGWTVEQCFDSIQRYVNRRNSNRRGNIESMRDLVKIAHFACIIFTKKAIRKDSITLTELNNIIEKVRGGRA